jgi:hypothetical protein
MEPEGSLPHSQQHATCPHPQADQSCPWPLSHVLKIYLNIILPSLSGSSKWILTLGFPHKNHVHTHHHSATCTTHPILVDFIIRTILGEEYRSWSSRLWSFLHFPVTSSLFGPNILHSTIFSHTLRLRSSVGVNNHVSHPYKTKGTIILLFIIIFIFLDSQLEYKALRTEAAQHFPDFNPLLITQWTQLAINTLMEKLYEERKTPT